MSHHLTTRNVQVRPRRLMIKEPGQKSALFGLRAPEQAGGNWWRAYEISCI